MAGEQILLVGGEPSTDNQAQLNLEQAGFKVETVGDGKAALAFVKAKKTALIVLDLMLPEEEGCEVCLKVREEEKELLILILTAVDEGVEEIVELELGADDYMTKPFNPRELVARVKALLRRAKGEITRSMDILELGDLIIDQGAREVFLNYERIEFCSQEFDLLVTFANNRGAALSREKLLSLAWRYDFYGQTRTVDVHVAYLRKRLADSSVEIESVPGVGYKLVV